MIEVHISDTTDVIDIPDPHDPVLLNRIGALATLMIKQRTARGLGPDKTPFAQYSKSWAEFRKQTGRQTKFRDLNYYGRMMAAMTHTTKPKSGSVKIFFSSITEATKAYKHHYKIPFHKPTFFFQLDGNEIGKLTKMVEQYMEEGP